MSLYWFVLFSEAFAIIPVAYGILLNQWTESITTAIMALLGVVFHVCQSGICGAMVQYHLEFVEEIVFSSVPASLTCGMCCLRDNSWNAVIILLNVVLTMFMSYDQTIRQNWSVSAALCIFGAITIAVCWITNNKQKLWLQLNWTSLIPAFVCLVLSYVFRYSFPSDYYPGLNNYYIYHGVFHILSYLTIFFSQSVGQRQVLFGFWIRPYHAGQSSCV